MTDQRNEITAGDGDNKQHWFFALIATYRLHAAIILLALGLGLFLGQMITIGTTVRPDNLFAWVVVYDFAEYNAAAAEREKAGDAASDPAQHKPLPRTDGHYFGAPAAGFAERFAAFREKVPAAQDLRVVPVQMRQVENRRVVPAGEPERAVQSVLDETFYYHLTLTPENAAILLRQPLAAGAVEAGRQFIGPFPFTPATTGLELLETDGARQTLLQLPESASALQGMIVGTAAVIEPNALLLLPGGDRSAGDFVHAVSGFNTELANAVMAAAGQEQRPEIVPAPGFSDVRHDLAAWLLATAGECLFLIGGFLLCYHLFLKIAGREPKEGRPLGSWLIGACRLMRDQGRVYALTIALFMVFWLWGMISAYSDPGSQARLVQVFSNQLSGSSWPLGFAGRAYAGGNIFEAALATFVVNFFWGTVVVLTLPSLIPIGTAFLINALRGSMIGQALAPTKAFFGQALVPHLVTMVVELQGYLIAGFFAVLLAVALYKPERMNYESRWQAFKDLVLWQFKILPLIGIILAIAALYEAIEIIAMRMFF